MAHDPAALALARRYGLTLADDAPPAPSPADVPVAGPVTSPGRPAGTLASWLTAHGWVRDMADRAPGHCGTANPWSGLGYCERSARWTNVTAPYCVHPVCAEHARQLTERMTGDSWAPRA